MPCHQDDRFPSSVCRPTQHSPHLHASHRPIDNQVISGLVPRHTQNLGFDGSWDHYDASSVVHLHSSLLSTSDVFLRLFPLTLLTPALYWSNPRAIWAPFLKTESEGPIPHPTYSMWLLLPGCRHFLAHCARDRASDALPLFDSPSAPPNGETPLPDTDVIDHTTSCDGISG